MLAALGLVLYTWIAAVRSLPRVKSAEGPARAMTPAASRFEAASTIAPSTELAPSAALEDRAARARRRPPTEGEDVVHRLDLRRMDHPLAVAAERERALAPTPAARVVVERRVGAVDRLEAEARAATAIRASA